MQYQIYFNAPNTIAECDFWTHLYDLKLNKLKLSDDTHVINSFIHNFNIKITMDSFSNNKINVHSEGILKNFNTSKDFISFDKKDFLNKMGHTLLNCILNNQYVPQSKLNEFVLLSFADLKTYKFVYWFGYPAIIPNNHFYCENIYEINLKINFNNNVIIGLLLKDNSYFQFTFEESLQYEEIIYVVNDKFEINDDKIFISWHLRNILAFFSLKNIGYSHKIGKFIKLAFPKENILQVFEIILPFDSFSNENSLKILGWQPNDTDKKSKPNIIDLSGILDKKTLMEQSVDLNVKLMKWRLWTDLDINQLSNTKCLLIGAGTLGCAVARTLMGWGIKNITFIDNGKVSYSNPSRQCLFEFDDHNEFKAIVASQRLQKIFPGMKSIGEIIDIQMPGHPIELSESVINSINRLEYLIKTHDVIFTLTDTRESRWLPTLMAKAFNKILINSALDFDSYLVMRQGTKQNPHVGCYFCMDIMTPSNSLINRTLDQQCTVTRPGLSFIAAGLAVELAISLINSNNKIQEDIPHQIRGFVSTFEQILIKSIAFNNCIACSENIINAFYHNESIDIELLKKVCDDSLILQHLSGIDNLISTIDNNIISDTDDF